MALLCSHLGGRTFGLHRTSSSSCLIPLVMDQQQFVIVGGFDAGAAVSFVDRWVNLDLMQNADDSQCANYAMHDTESIRSKSRLMNWLPQNIVFCLKWRDCLAKKQFAIWRSHYIGARCVIWVNSLVAKHTLMAGKLRFCLPFQVYRHRGICRRIAWIDWTTIRPCLLKLCRSEWRYCELDLLFNNFELTWSSQWKLFQNHRT